MSIATIATPRSTSGTISRSPRTAAIPLLSPPANYRIEARGSGRSPSAIKPVDSSSDQERQQLHPGGVLAQVMVTGIGEWS
ncbi:hypothetical protein GCM10023171_21300 [Microbacterium panaciterrae]|uniref:Uncharacterized protein n=1 Tax=Microbacterium panaciterrae TaxID=985759 RepID=A0ABP8PEB3_9MICO